MADKDLKVTALSLQDFDRLIHSPARLLIMKILYVLDGADMVFLKTETGLTWGNLSVQVKKLEEARYVTMQKEFVDNRPHTVISMTKQGRVAFNNYSERLKKLLF